MDVKSIYHFNPFKIRTLADQRFFVIWTVFSFIASLMLTSAMAFVVVFMGKKLDPYFSPPSSLGNKENEGPPELAAIPPWQVFGTDKITFILLGYDEVDRFAHRSDTLMVGAVDFYARTIRIVSIPRDTLVKIPRHGFTKVNAAYALGHEDLVLQTMEEFFGVSIDYIVAVNYEGFVQVVDALGGVDVDIEHAMNYDDRRGHTHIHLDAGVQHLDGEQALNYARFRQEARGDFARIERQQGLLKALLEQAIRPTRWTRMRLDIAARAIQDNIKVTRNPESVRTTSDIGFEQIVSLIGFLSRLGNQDVTFYQIPTDDLRYQGLSCLVPIYSDTREMLKEVFADFAPLGWNTPEGPDFNPAPWTGVQSTESDDIFIN
ncbi:MAG: LCP family protein [bacterium]